MLGTMLVLPVTLMSSLALALLLMQQRVRRLHVMVRGLVGLLALQGLIVSLVQYYGVADLRALQVIGAAVIPPFAWLAFQGSAIRRLCWPRDAARHAIAPMLVVLLLLASPGAWVDLTLIGIYLAYAAALLITVVRLQGDLPRIYLDQAGLSAMIWMLIALSLIASALSDILIVGLNMSGYGHWQGAIISVFSATNLLLIGWLSLLPGHDPDSSADPGEATVAVDLQHDIGQHDERRHEGRKPVTRDTLEHDALEHDARRPLVDDDTEDHQRVLAQVDRLMRDQALYLDRDLTLLKLARKSGVPAKQLSTAINAASGENVSRYVNRYRIEAALPLLRDGESVIDTLEAVGFNTKSNFNREFRRVLGMSPTEWRNRHETTVMHDRAPGR